MISSIIWVFLCFILLLQDCIAPKTYFITQDSKAHNRRRTQIKDIAEKDPCGVGIWVLMKSKEKKFAKKQCEEAYNLFVALPSKNQDSCLNAASPDCRPLAQCDRLKYGCTFVCDSTVAGVSAGVGTGVQKPRQYGKSETEIGIFEQEIEPIKIIKRLKNIVEGYSGGIAARRDNYSRSKDGSSGSGTKGNEQETEN